MLPQLSRRQLMNIGLIASGMSLTCSRSQATDPPEASEITKDTNAIGEADIAIVGVPYDLATTNRPGARFGPKAVRDGRSMIESAPWPWCFVPSDLLSIFDHGDFALDFRRPRSVPDEITDQADALLSLGVSSLVAIGGDHFVSYPLLRAYARHHGQMALVHFDAHSDTWPAERGSISHGTMFYHAVKEGLIDPACSVQVGIRTSNPDPLGMTWLDANWVNENSTSEVVARIKQCVGTRKAYLSFDIDCLDPSCAPGTGTPVVGGLTTQKARAVLAGLDGINFVGMDLVEVAPAYDNSGITALAGATLIEDYLCLRAQHLPASLKK